VRYIVDHERALPQHVETDDGVDADGKRILKERQVLDEYRDVVSLDGAELQARRGGDPAANATAENGNVGRRGFQLKLSCELRTEDGGIRPGIKQEIETAERADRALDDDQVVSIELEPDTASCQSASFSVIGRCWMTHHRRGRQNDQQPDVASPHNSHLMESHVQISRLVPQFTGPSL